MLSIALLAPLARVAPRRLAWGFRRRLRPARRARFRANAEDAGAGAGRRPRRPGPLARPRQGSARRRAARVEVVVGQLDPRLHLAPCERIEPYLPPNVRLWGKSRIGLRCTQGRTAWNVYLPIIVKVWGRALVVPGRRGGRQRARRKPTSTRPRSTSPRSSRRPSSTASSSSAAPSPRRFAPARRAPGPHQVAPVVRRRRHRQGRRRRRGLRARRRRPGADQRHRGPAGARSGPRAAASSPACRPASAAWS